MDKYRGLVNVLWFISGFIWGNLLSKLLGLDVAWAIGFIVFAVAIIVTVTVLVVELRRD